MTRRPISYSTSFSWSLCALLLLLWLGTGCPPRPGPGKPADVEITPPIVASEAVRSLEKAQKLFNESGGMDRPSTEVPAASLQKYQQVVDIVEKEVLGKVNKPLEMNAYVLLAFSQWRLGNSAKAMEAGNLGRQLYEMQKLATNRRDYGMCLIVGGLCLATQTYKEYERLQGPPTKEQRQSLTGRLQQALQAIDPINNQLDRQEDIVVYANQWQLAIIDAAARIWTSEGLTQEVWQPEVCRWLNRAEPVLAKFPAASYPQENTTRTYKNKFERQKRAYCQGP